MILWLESDFRLELGFQVWFSVTLSLSLHLLSPALRYLHRCERCLAVPMGRGKLSVLLLQPVPSLSCLILFLWKDLLKAWCLRSGGRREAESGQDPVRWGRYGRRRAERRASLQQGCEGEDVMCMDRWGDTHGQHLCTYTSTDSASEHLEAVGRIGGMMPLGPFLSWISTVPG